MIPTSRGMILIVDDDLDCRTLLASLLKSHGYEAHAVESGYHAIAAAHDRKYAVILLDFMLADLNGFEVVRGLKATNRELLKRIIVLSGADPSMLEALEAEEPQLFRVLRKPVQIAALVEAIESCMASNDVQTPVGSLPPA